MQSAPLILTPDGLRAAMPRRLVGGKAAALAALDVAGLPVPAWFAVTPSAFDASLSDEARAALAAARRGGLAPARLPEVLAHLQPSEAVVHALEGALRALGDGAALRVAVRSSASDEDGAAHSFAGQLESYLFVPPGCVPARVADVWRSGFSPRILAYRRERGLPPVPSPPAVLVQRMVDAEAAGVAFSADPVTGDRARVVIAAVRGLASALVDGREEGEGLRVDAAGRVVKTTPARQTTADRFDAEAGEGVASRPVEPGPVLMDADAARVAELARAAEAHFGVPQDIEWALAGGRLFLLQSRPITTLAPEGMLRLWDNSNIVESYGGVTTPLTYSFARRAYEAVYRAFCRLLGVPEARLAAHDDVFAQMIGLVRGRVYYNLVSWYRVLALLPGYRLNAPFMEAMMGVKEGIPDALRPEPPSGTRLGDALASVRTLVGLVAAHARLPRLRRAFLARLGDALTLPDGGLDALDLDGLAAYYRRLDRALLTRWDAPLVNDFFAMIFFGLAQKLADRWVGEGALGPLLTGGDVLSAEPARWVRRLAERAAEDPAWAETLRDGPLDAVRAGLAARPDWAGEVDAYLDRFGDRCLEELKLESPTLADDPLPLFRAVGGMAARLRDEPLPAPGAVEAEMRAEAEARMRAALRGHPVRRAVFGWVLRHARARVRDRENLRFERTRVFGRARRIFLAMGARLAEAGRLDAPRDVFYLTLDELLGAADGTAASADLTALARAREAEFDRYRAAPAPPERFTTRGAVALSPLTPVLASGADAEAGEVRQGLGCCPGVVEGPVRVVRDPRGVTLALGTVLVAERTDPGWILLFPACAGLVVERGSLLSHSAIVARELGIPTAVGVAGATGWLRDGDRVRLDGATGRVVRLAAAGEELADPVEAAHA